MTCCIGKGNTIADGIELIAVWLLELDGKADEVVRRGALFPVHSEEAHAFPAVDGKGEKGLGIATGDDEVGGGGVCGSRELRRGGLGPCYSGSVSWRHFFRLLL